MTNQHRMNTNIKSSSISDTHAMRYRQLTKIQKFRHLFPFSCPNTDHTLMEFEYVVQMRLHLSELTSSLSISLISDLSVFSLCCEPDPIIFELVWACWKIFACKQRTKFLTVLFTLLVNHFINANLNMIAN